MTILRFSLYKWKMAYNIYLNKILIFLLTLLPFKILAQNDNNATFNVLPQNISIRLAADIPSLKQYEEYAYTTGFSILYQYLFFKGTGLGVYGTSVYSPGIRSSANVKYRYITNAINPMLYVGYDIRFFKKRLVQSIGVAGGYHFFWHYSKVKDRLNNINRSYTTALGFLNRALLLQTHYYVKPNFAVGMAYRYHSMPLTYYYSQNLELGIRYNFSKK